MAQGVTAAPSLVATGLTAGYGVDPVIRDISLNVHPGEIVVLLGVNGAGKTTTMLTLAGEISPMSGTVDLLGIPQRGPLHKRARAGLAFLPEGSAIFPQLTVKENLRVSNGDPDAAFEYAPLLGELRHRRAGLCSGGEQRLLAVVRVLITKPSVIMVDELSLGLAPVLLQQLFDLLRVAADEGCAVLMVEQFAVEALTLADRGYVMRRGRIVLEGVAADLRARLDEIEAVYLRA